MSNEYRIRTVIDANATNSSGESGKRIREVKVSYMKGRGVVLHVWTKTVCLTSFGTSESFNMFGDGNMSTIIEPMKRIKPTVLKALGERLEANAEAIHTLMDNWHDDDVWEEQSRKASLLIVSNIVRGTIEAHEVTPKAA